MKRLSQFVIFVIGTGLSMQATSAEVVVSWQEPDGFTDIVAGRTQGKNKFREKMFNQFEKTIEEKQLNYLKAILSK